MDRTVRGEFARYVSLNVMGMVGMSCYILADTFFIARALGSDGLTALNFCISVFSVLQGVGLMLGIGGATRFAIWRSSGDQAQAGVTLTHTLALGGAAAAAFLALGLWGAGPLAIALGADRDTLPLAASYLTTVLSFSPCFLLNNILLAFVRNDGAPGLSMGAMLVSSFSNIVLDYLLMFPLNLGMFGAALATGLSPVISLCVLSLHGKKPQCGLRPGRCRLERGRLGDILLLGVSALIAELASAVSLVTFNLVILSLEGNVGVAAYGIVANIALVAVSMFTGVAQGLQPLASRGYAAQDGTMLRQVRRYALVTALALACVIYGLVLALGPQIVSVFNSGGGQVLGDLALRGLRVYFAGFFFAGVNVVCAAFLSATARGGGALLISGLRSCLLLVPMVLTLSAVGGMDGVWCSFVLTEFAVCLLSGWTAARGAVPAGRQGTGR